jgi:hypothetical protein
MKVTSNLDDGTQPPLDLPNTKQKATLILYDVQFHEEGHVGDETPLLLQAGLYWTR